MTQPSANCGIEGVSWATTVALSEGVATGDLTEAVGVLDCEAGLPVAPDKVDCEAGLPVVTEIVDCEAGRSIVAVDVDVDPRSGEEDVEKAGIAVAAGLTV